MTDSVKCYDQQCLMQLLTMLHVMIDNIKFYDIQCQML